jgi:hypothetical protein
VLCRLLGEFIVLVTHDGRASGAPVDVVPAGFALLSLSLSSGGVLALAAAAGLMVALIVGRESIVQHPLRRYSLRFLW